jgi:hypothetical protein
MHYVDRISPKVFNAAFLAFTLTTTKGKFTKKIMWHKPGEGGGNRGPHFPHSSAFSRISRIFRIFPHFLHFRIFPHFPAFSAFFLHFSQNPRMANQTD